MGTNENCVGLFVVHTTKTVGRSSFARGIVHYLHRTWCCLHRDVTPVMLDYQTQAENDSMYNTPPCWSMYICGLVFAYMLEQGGLQGALQRNELKAKVCPSLILSVLYGRAASIAIGRCSMIQIVIVELWTAGVCLGQVSHHSYHAWTR